MQWLNCYRTNCILHADLYTPLNCRYKSLVTSFVSELSDVENIIRWKISCNIEVFSTQLNSSSLKHGSRMAKRDTGK